MDGSIMNISFFQNGQTMRAINTFKALPGNSFFHKARTNIRACLETHLSIMKRFNSMLAMAI